MRTAADQSPALREMVQRIAQAVRPDKIILFGSRARDEAGSASDLDLLVIAPSSLPKWRRAASLYRLLGGIGVPKDVLWWTQEEVDEWGSVKSHFITTVVREGKVLYEGAP